MCFKKRKAENDEKPLSKPIIADGIIGIGNNLQLYYEKLNENDLDISILKRIDDYYCILESSLGNATKDQLRTLADAQQVYASLIIRTMIAFQAKQERFIPENRFLFADIRPMTCPEKELKEKMDRVLSYLKTYPNLTKEPSLVKEMIGILSELQDKIDVSDELNIARRALLVKKTSEVIDRSSAELFKVEEEDIKKSII